MRAFLTVISLREGTESMKKRKQLLTGLVATLCLGVCAYAQVAVDDTYSYKIKNANSGLVLGISGMNQTAGTAVVQWSDNGTADHLWHFLPMGNNQYNIENMYTHQVLGISNASTANGAQALQWADNGTADHLWQFYKTSSGNYKIKNVNSGLYLEVYNASTSTSAVVDQWGDTGCNCQEWQLVSSGANAYVFPGGVSGSGISVHDPMLWKDSSGVYWLYGTHNTRARSTDRTTFTTNGVALSPIPSWVSSWNSSNDLWAPHVIYHDSKYWQYYAVPGSNGTTHTAAIALATASSPNSTSWSDQGIVVQSNDSSSFNAIDPGLLQDAGGAWWMSFGSWYNGIYLMQLSSSTGKQSGSTTYHLAQRANGIEGATPFYYNGSYYLFASINGCCAGTSSTYRIVVGRSSSVTGPYLDRGGIDMLNGGGTILLSSHGNIYGPGGQSVYADADGPVLVYHYYDGNNNGAPTLGINLLGFDSAGWPYVK